MGIAWNLQFSYDKMAIFTMLFLQVHDYGGAFHLLISQLLSSVIWSSCRIGLLLVWLDLYQGILYYLWLLKRVLFSQFCSWPIYKFYKGGLVVFLVNFVSSHIAEGVYQLWAFCGRIFWLLVYIIMPSANSYCLSYYSPISSTTIFLSCH